jgi:hypothetical protein
MSTVSVIVPCYNYARYLPDCVDSIVSQEGVDVRVLVIDDASTDHTPAVCAALAQRDRRVSVRRHEQNLGHIATYNEGLSWADGDYVALVSADDMLTPGALARAADLMDAHPDVGLVYGSVAGLHDGVPPAPARVPRSPRAEVRSGRDWIEGRCRTAQSCIFSPEAVVRGSLQRDLGGYRPDLPHAGDLEMWLRLASVADVARFPDVDQAYFRSHRNSMQRTRFSSPLRQLEQRKRAFEVFFAERGRRLDGAAALRRRAMRQLAAEAVESVASAASFAAAGRRSPEIAELLRFALDCVTTDTKRSPTHLATTQAQLRLVLLGLEAWPRSRFRSLYSSSATARMLTTPLLRVLGLAPAWASVPQTD